MDGVKTTVSFEYSWYLHEIVWIHMESCWLIHREIDLMQVRVHSTLEVGG